MPNAGRRESAAQLLPGLTGLWIALALIKLGNPVILDPQITPPTNRLEAIYQSWPMAWGYGVFAVVFVIGMAASGWSFRTSPAQSSRFPLFLLPFPWLIWQGASALQTIQPSLTQSTLPHFLVCGLSFFLGFRGFGDGPGSKTLWLGVAGGWLVVVAIGWRQHFGGLAETREFFQSLPNWREQSPELIAKVASDRIYSTLVYPNALAGAMILFTPALVLGLWELLQHKPTWMRVTLAALPAAGAIGCLVWSGSKGGWLIAVAISLLAWVLRPGLDGKTGRAHWIGPLFVVLLAMGGFWLRYSDYFSRGATSISARLDYWKVACSNTCARPLLGTGPGTFMLVYRQGKPPEAEMTRLVHNDYLQQTTDSGVLGGIFFAGLVGWVVWTGYRRHRRQRMNPTWFGIWLGIIGLSLQSLTEFGLYIPALAWPWFFSMGALCGHIDSGHNLAGASTPVHPDVVGGDGGVGPDGARPLGRLSVRSPGRLEEFWRH